MAAENKRPITIRVKRSATGKREDSAWEEFEVPWEPQMNVISALMAIQRSPKTKGGKDTSPVVWEQACLEEVCGSCTMLINGKVRQACTSLIDALSPNGEVIELEPMTKFPLVRDLIVDRSRMFDNLKRGKAWIFIDGTHALGAGPRQSPEEQEVAYPLSRCMTCGCCTEACPNVNDRSSFMGPAVVSQVRLFNMHPSGKMNANERLDAMMGEGGIAECGKAQNCVQVCPKEIPLTESLAVIGRDTLKRALFGWLLK
ncbi:MAG: succinate dehydrogenase iron-sulfur subunit [Deltaproteobacteria bacterium]|nr:succinate dehydrogenase iron-sulfur subunit [Deltaproteobacteria bacterium]